MNNLHLFLPCAGGVETYLADEAARIMGSSEAVQQQMGGVAVKGSWRQAMQLNLHSRLASRILVGVMQRPYRSEDDIYEAACDVAWEIWFTQKQTFKIDITATRSPLKSLNFAALRVKDAICDRFRHKTGDRPSVDTQRPDARVYLHLSAEHASLYVDTSGEPLFKRGWRQDKGDAPLKETLAAAAARY
jgi:putative N6-adenine-specific DNA methylase